MQEQISQQSADLKGQIAAANTAISSLQAAQKGLEAQVSAAKDAAAAAKEAAVVADANAQTAQKAADAAKAVAEKAKEAADAAKASGDAAAIAAANADLKAAEAAKQAAKAILDAAEADKKAAAAQLEAAAAKQAAAQAEANAIAKAAAELKEAKAELNAEIEKLKAADQSNAEAIAKIEAEILKIKGDMDKQIGRIDAVVAKANKNAEDIVAINKAAAALATKVEANVTKLAQVDKDLAVVATRLNGLDEAVKGLNAAVAELQKKDEALLKSITALEAADKELANSIEKVANNLKLAEDALNARINGLKEDIDKQLQAHNEKIGNLEAGLQLQKDELANFKELTEKNFKDVNDRLDAANKATAEYIESNNKRVEAIEADVKKAQEELATVDARISAEITKLNNALTAEINKLQGLVDANSDAIEANKKSIEENKKEAKELIAKLEAYVIENDGKLQGNIDALKKALEEADKILDGKIEANSTAITELRAELMGLIADNRFELEEFINTEVNKLNEALSTLQDQVAEHAAKIASLEEADKALKASIQQLDEKLFYANAALKEYIRAAKEHIKEAQADIAEIQEVLKSNTYTDAQIDEKIQAVLDKLANYYTKDEVKQIIDTEVQKAENALNDLITKQGEEISKIQGRLTTLETEFASIQKEWNEVLKKQMEQLGKDVETVKQMPTAVSLYVSGFAGQDHNANAAVDDALNLKLANIPADSTWVFGEGLGGTPISFEKNKATTTASEFMIRVSPLNAQLTKEMIHIVNSQNVAIDDLVEYDVKPYKGLLHSRSGEAQKSENGLWTVSVKLRENFNAEDFKNACETKDGKAIAYAVRLGNDQARQVISEYDLTVDNGKGDSFYDLQLHVDDTPLKEIRNRWWDLADHKAKTEVQEAEVDYIDLAWKNTASNANNVFIDKKTTEPDASDYRNNLEAHRVKTGVPFKVHFKLTGDITTTDTKVRGFYVTLDEQCAVESGSSEIHAWRNYAVEGINKVVEGLEADITLPKNCGANDEFIGFRVHAVNYDGTLVDPDGKAFYVYVGDELAVINEKAGAANLNELKQAPFAVQDRYTTDMIDLDLSKWKSTVDCKLVPVVEYKYNNKFNSLADYQGAGLVDPFDVATGNKIKFYDAKKQPIAYSKIVDGNKIKSSITDVRYVRVENIENKNFLTGEYRISFKVVKGHQDAVKYTQASFIVKKALPGFPSYVKFVDGFAADKVLKIYPAAADKVSQSGYSDYYQFDIKSVLSNLGSDNFTNVVDNASTHKGYYLSEPEKTPILVPVHPSNPRALNANFVRVHWEKFLNPENVKTYGKEIAIQIGYNYINTNNELAYKAATKDYVVNYKNRLVPFCTYKIQLLNYTAETKYAWNKEQKLTYSPLAGTINIPFADLKITNGADSLNFAKFRNVGAVETKHLLASNDMSNVSVVLETKDGKVSDYFDNKVNMAKIKDDGTIDQLADFVKDSGEQTHFIITRKATSFGPTTDTELILKITLKDEYGFTIVKKLPVLFKAN